MKLGAVLLRCADCALGTSWQRRGWKVGTRAEEEGCGLAWITGRKETRALRTKQGRVKADPAGTLREEEEH